MPKRELKELLMFTGTTMCANYYTDDTIEYFDWPFCVVPGCQNRIACQFPTSQMCHPHTLEKLTLLADLVSQLEPTPT